MGQKFVNQRWDFKSADTKTYTHGFHAYPAVMIPQIAGELIDLYGKNARLLFDPYCGSGTSLVEARLRGINSVGTDLNPLARLISKAKTTFVDLRELDHHICNFNDLSFLDSFSRLNLHDQVLPRFNNIDFWFSKSVQYKLSYIKSFIDNIPNNHVADLFRVAFSETVRESSWTRNGEFKLYRMPAEKRAIFDPDVFAIMNAKLKRLRNGIGDFVRDASASATAKVYAFNTVDGVPAEIVQNNSVDIIVTSPPYGDSHTTVAYGQYSRLSSEWLGFEGASKVDRILMGGYRVYDSDHMHFDSPVLLQALDKIRQTNETRFKEVAAFYRDYRKSINNIAPLVKIGGYVCYVVGNRKVKGVVLPTDAITIDLFSIHGFEHIVTIVRNIPNKRMPSKNSPSNVPGQLDSTMTNEYIVVLRRIS